MAVPSSVWWVTKFSLRLSDPVSSPKSQPLENASWSFPEMHRVFWGPEMHSVSLVSAKWLRMESQRSHCLEGMLSFDSFLCCFVRNRVPLVPTPSEVCVSVGPTQTLQSRLLPLTGRRQTNLCQTCTPGQRTYDQVGPRTGSPLHRTVRAPQPPSRNK